MASSRPLGGASCAASLTPGLAPPIPGSREARSRREEAMSPALLRQSTGLPVDASAPIEARVLACLSMEPQLVDQIARAAGVTVPETLAALLALGWSGLAIARPGQRWVRNVKATHALEALLARGLATGLALDGLARRAARGSRGSGIWRTGSGCGARVAEDNLARAFPERDDAARAAILVAHYRELGRVACEYARMPDLVRGGWGADRARDPRARAPRGGAWRVGRGVILLTGHYGNFELLGALLGRMHPVDFIVKPLSNPAMEAWLVDLRRRSGVGLLPIGSGVRRVFASLRANRWIAMVADQDARRHGVFVPFLGRPASTPIGPAEHRRCAPARRS